MKNTNFKLVSIMNAAFGNPQGTPTHADIDWKKVRKQCLNIPDEVGELFIALGADPAVVKDAVDMLKKSASATFQGVPDLDATRDALCDIHVFGYGAHHIMGIDADRDMETVVGAVMTRFIKDEADLETTRAKFAAKGVTETYTEGEYPTMILKSAVDQPDAPQGKFLKAASYSEPVFYPIQRAVWPFPIGTGQAGAFDALPVSGNGQE